MSKIGAGLESLIPQKKVNNDSDYSVRKESVFFIETDKIKSNPYQPRKEFDREALKALSDSIKQHGVLQPLVVSRIGTGGTNIEYQLIAGERRLMASRLAGLKQVPVIIREPGSKEKLVLSLIENIQREDLNSMEKAEAYKQLLDEFNLMQKDVAQLMGKSKEAVSNSLRLLQLPDKIKLALKKSIISEGHAKALLSVRDEKKVQEIFNKIIRENLSVRETESLCNRSQNIEASKIKSIDLEELDNIKVIKEKLDKYLTSISNISKFKFKKSEGKSALTLYFDDDSNLDDFLKNLK